jgi:LmbE family N-acetylglucosaminyl deacetylase
VDIFYTPHPDDETLSMGVLIADDVQRGDRVIVVALTDGRTTGAVRDINARLRAERSPSAGGQGPLRSITADQVAADRIRELDRATSHLGVTAGDVVRARLDDPSSDCGAVVTVSEALHVMRPFAARFPGATHITMSDVAERQQDHLDAGAALHELVADHTVTSAAWTVSRLWWQLPSPTWRWVTPVPKAAARVEEAAGDYQLWAPARAEYAVGLYSVRWQFAALHLDPRDRVHDLAVPR